MNHKDVKDRSRGDRYNAINTTFAINARRANISRCNVRRPRIILEERFLLVPEPRRSFPLIKNNDCSFERSRSHSWRRRNGIGTGIIIISLLFFFFFFSLLFFLFSSPGNLAATGTHKTVVTFKDEPVTFAIFALSRISDRQETDDGSKHTQRCGK